MTQPSLLVFAVLLLTSTGFDHRRPVARIHGEPITFDELIPEKELAAEQARLSAAQLITWSRTELRTRLSNRIWLEVFGDYTREKHLEPSEEEISSCAVAMQKSNSVDWDPAFGPVPLDLEFAAHLITLWKRDQALFREYGGRVIFQQFGVEPIDAWQKLLERADAKREFVILDPELKGSAYDYFTNNKFTALNKDGGGEFFEKALCFQ